MHVDAEMINHYAPDTGACVRAILALLALPLKDDRCSPLTKERSGQPQPAQVKSPAVRSVAQRRRRAKAARHAAQ